MLVILRRTPLFSFYQLPVFITTHSASWLAKVAAACKYIVFVTSSLIFLCFLISCFLAVDPLLPTPLDSV